MAEDKMQTIARLRSEIESWEQERSHLQQALSNVSETIATLRHTIAVIQHEIAGERQGGLIWEKVDGRPLCAKHGVRLHFSPVGYYCPDCSKSAQCP